MKSVLLVPLVIFFSEICLAQSATTKPYFYFCDFCCVDISPEYTGGNAAMRKLFTDSVHYPEMAEKQEIGGKIIVQYAVDTFGNTIDVTIVKGLRKDFNMEVIRLITLLKGWLPATLNGHKTTHYLMQPFTFKAYRPIKSVVKVKRSAIKKRG